MQVLLAHLLLCDMNLEIYTTENAGCASFLRLSQLAVDRSAMLVYVRQVVYRSERRVKAERD